MTMLAPKAFLYRQNRLRLPSEDSTFKDASWFFDGYIFLHNHQRTHTKTERIPLELRWRPFLTRFYFLQSYFFLCCLTN